MCTIKVGDYVKTHGEIWEVFNSFKDKLHLQNFVKKNEHFFIDCNQVKKVNPDYILSSRHRLAIRIQESGFTAVALSEAAGKNRYYFGTEIKETRFNSRGDLSDKQAILLFGRLDLAIEKLKNPVPDLSDEKYNLELEVKTSYEELKPFAKAVKHTLSKEDRDLAAKIIYNNQDLAKTNEREEANFAKILFLVLLIIVLSFVVKINFF